MNFSTIKTTRILPALLVAATLTGGVVFVQEADAAPGAGMGGGMQGGGMQGKGMQGKGMHGGGHRKHGAGGCKHGCGSCGKHLYGGCWKKTLSAEQKARLDQLHVNFAKTKAPLKARIKVLKLDLTILAIAPQPEKAVIDAKIAELLRLKGQMLGAKYGYVAAQRQVLAPQQQVAFDMEQIHRAMHGKQKKGGHGGRH